MVQRLPSWEDNCRESIIIGGITAGSAKGYMLLYIRNAHKRNSFPCEASIAKLLKQIIQKEILKTGERKVVYFDWQSYGDLNKQRQYFSEVVSHIAESLCVD